MATLAQDCLKQHGAVLCVWSPVTKMLVEGWRLLGMRGSFRSPYRLSLCIMSSATCIVMGHGLLVAFVAVTKCLIK